MNQTTIRTLSTLAFGAIATGAAAQSDQRIAVPLTDPSRPAVLEIALFMGDIHVEAYDGNEVVITADAPVRNTDEPEKPRDDGLKLIQSSTLGLTVEEDDNTVSVRMDFSPKTVDLEIRVPRRTSVHASLVNGGDVEVVGVDGVHELSNVNGDIEDLASHDTDQLALRSRILEMQTTNDAVLGPCDVVLHENREPERATAMFESPLRMPPFAIVPTAFGGRGMGAMARGEF